LRHGSKHDSGTASGERKGATKRRQYQYNREIAVIEFRQFWGKRAPLSGID